jgi:hypothetical protein
MLCLLVTQVTCMGLLWGTALKQLMLCLLVTQVTCMGLNWGRLIVSGKCINEVLETVDALPARYASNLYGAPLGYCLETVDALPARYASNLYGAQLGAIGHLLYDCTGSSF